MLTWGKCSCEFGWLPLTDTVRDHQSLRPVADLRGETRCQGEARIGFHLVPGRESSRCPRRPGGRTAKLSETLATGPSRGQACKSQPLMASGHRPALLPLTTGGHPRCPFSKRPSAGLVPLFLIQIVLRAGRRSPRPRPCAFAQRGNGQRCLQFVAAVTTSLRPCLPHPGPRHAPRSDHGRHWRVEFYLRKSTCLPTCPALES